MWETVSLTLRSYWTFYVTYFGQQWHDLTPMTYGMLLIGVGVGGYLLMRGASKR